MLTRMVAPLFTPKRLNRIDMARIERVPGGGLISVQLEDEDLQFGWREFVKRIERLPGYEYDKEFDIHYLHETHFHTVVSWKKELLVYVDPNQTELF